MPSYHDNKRGIIALVSACALYTVNDTLTKLLALRYPTGEVIFARGIICLMCLGAMLIYARELSSLRHIAHPKVALRALLDAVSNIAFVLALSRMRLADLLAVNLVSPLLLTMLLAFFFKEPIGWRRWCAIAVGFAGTLLIVKPSATAFNIWSLVAFVAACTSATRDVTTRSIQPGVPTLMITFVSLGSTTMAALLLAIFTEETWQVPQAEHIGFIGVAAVVLSIGSVLGVSAFRNVDLSVVAPFRYSLLIWGALAGYFVFHEVSDLQSICGSLLIVGSGLYTLHRERVRHQELSAKVGLR